MTVPKDPRIKDFVGAVQAHLNDDVAEPYYLVLRSGIDLYECSRCGAAVPFRAFNKHDASHLENEPLSPPPPRYFNPYTGQWIDNPPVRKS